MITRHDGKNSGSLDKIYLKLKSDISNTNTPINTEVSLAISDDITLTGTWTEVQFKKGEASWQEVQTEDETGVNFDFTVQCSIHQDRQAVSEALAGFVGRELMVITKDRNDGNHRLLGESGLYEYPARLTYQQTKEKAAGRNAYDITITCTMHHPACYYSGNIPTT